MMFNFENQKYIGECLDCKKRFMGSKRDRVCRMCSEIFLTDDISRLKKKVVLLQRRNSQLETVLSTILIENNCTDTKT